MNHPETACRDKVVLGGKMTLKEDLKRKARKREYIGQILLSFTLERKMVSWPIANHDS